jgi:hypothetical protein
MPRPLLVFLHLGKTGGRTMDTVFRGTYGPAYVQAEAWRPTRPVGWGDGEFIIPTYDPADLRRLLRLCPWARAVGGHSLTLWSRAHELRPVRYVAFLRDPVARGISHYQYHVNTQAEPLDWDAWCAWREHHDHQTRYFDRDGDPERAFAAIGEHGVFVGLLERFDASLLLLRKLVAPELRPAYRRRNVAEKRDVAQALRSDPARLEQIRRMYAADQVLYDRVRREIWPRYEEAYGPGLAADAARLAAAPEAGFRHWHDRAGRALHRFWVAPAIRRAHRRYEQG